MKSGSNLNMLGNIISKFKVEPLAADPSSTPYLGSLSGAMYYNTTSGCYRVNNGQNWVDVVDIKGTNGRITVTYAGNPKIATIDLDPAFASMLVTSYLPLSGGTMTGTMYGPSISATNISAATINVGNVSNIEFGYLDGTSANIQNQLSTISASKQNNFTIAQNQVAVGGTNTVSGSSNLTYNSGVFGVGNGTGGSQITLNGAPAGLTSIVFQTSSTNRFITRFEDTNDQLAFIARNDDGSGRGNPLTLPRSASSPVIIGQASTQFVQLPSLSTSAVVVTDGSKNLVSSPVTTTELSYLTGATSNIQNQLNNMATTVGLSAYQLRSEKGASLGYAALDSNSKIYTSSIPDTILGQLHYSGTWNATTNSPTLPAPNTVSGAFYIVTVSGTSIPNGLNPNTSASIFSGTNKWFVGDWIVSDGTYWDKIDNTDSISTWNGRTGAIVPVAGDYTATQITNTPAGNIASTTVQAAINELDSEKVATTTTITAGTGLAGGGDLSTNRTISLATTGTSGTYTRVTTDAYGRVTAGTTLTSGDIPTLPPSKILEDANDRFVSDVQIVKWDSVYGSVSGTSANWNSVYSSVNATSASWNAASVSAHFHTNKTNLDLINQNLNTSSSPQFVKVNATSGFTVDNSYGSGNGLLYGTGDSANYTTNNIKLASWYGIGIWSSLNNNYTGYINTRTGALTMSGAITSDTSVNAPTMNEGGISLSAKYAPYSTYTTVQSNSADWDLNNITFREHANAGYSRIATFTNTAQGDTENIRILCNGYVNDSRKGSFDINFGAIQVAAMSATASTPILKVVANDNTTWSFGYTIDVDTSAAKTYTLWAYNGNSYAYLRGSVVSKRPYNSTIYTKDTPQAGLPSGYTASSYSDTRLNSITVDDGIASLALTGVGGSVSYLDASGKLQRSATTTTELTNIRGADTAIVYSNPGETGYIEFGSFTLTAATSSSVFYIDQTILVESYEMGQKESAIFHVDIRRNGWSGIPGGIRVLSKTYSDYLNSDWLTILSTDPLTATTMTFKVYGKIPASGYFRWRTTRLGGRSLIDTYANFGMSSYPRTIVSALPSPTASFTSFYQPDITHVVKNPTGDQTISGGYLRIQQTSAASGAFGAYVIGDAVSRWFAYTDGRMEWGPGTANRDTVLYRSTTNTLRTDGIFNTSAMITTSNGLGMNVRIGDDVWLGDINVANTMSLRGFSSSDVGYIRFGSDNNNFGFDGSKLIYTGSFGVTSDISAGNFYDTGFAGSKVLISDSSKAIAESSISTTTLNYLSGVTSDIQTQLNTKISIPEVKEIYNWYSSRPSNCDLAPDGFGGIRSFVATSTMSANKPSYDSNIIHLGWDNTGGWDKQVAFQNLTGQIQTRGQNSGVWSSWITYWNDSNLPVTASHLSGTSANIQTQLDGRPIKTNTVYAGSFVYSVNIDLPENNTIYSFIGAKNITSGSTPFGNAYYNVIDVRHRNGADDGLSGYGGQLAWGMTNYKNQIAFRTRNVDGSWQTWNELWSNSNLPVTASHLSGTSANIQTQINNIRYGANHFTSAINIVYGAQSFTVNHNLGYLRPTVKLYDEAADDEILVTPIFVSTSQLVIPMSSSEAITGARLEVFV